MNSKVKWVARSAAAIALIIIFQLTTKAWGQWITGSCVNLVLALSALLFGPAVAAAAAIVSPFMAFFLNITPQIAVVPAIAVGNLTYVLVICLVVKLLKDVRLPEFARNLAAVIIAAACKCAIQYLLIVKWIAPAFLPEKAQAVMAVNFGIIQLFTASIGGALACVIYPLVKKGLQEK